MKPTCLLLSFVFGLIFGAAPAAAQTRAYVVTGNALTVIDTATDAVVGTIPLAGGPTRVTVSPDGTRAYVSISDTHSVTAIDTATDTVAATIPVADTPGLDGRDSRMDSVFTSFLQAGASR